MIKINQFTGSHHTGAQVIIAHLLYERECEELHDEITADTFFLYYKTNIILY